MTEWVIRKDTELSSIERMHSPVRGDAASLAKQLVSLMEKVQNKFKKIEEKNLKTLKVSKLNYRALFLLSQQTSHNTMSLLA
jgi:hypothetical protein